MPGNTVTITAPLQTWMMEFGFRLKSYPPLIPLAELASKALVDLYARATKKLAAGLNCASARTRAVAPVVQALLFRESSTWHDLKQD